MTLVARRRPASGFAQVATATKRVAIYTRQSVDRGDQFGSTDAQREAVEAYVASQRGLGWSLVPARYDDRGESGSTIERPAFQRLLADIDVGLVDVIAVYKIDRLSRSLLDFTHLMQRFERKSVEFVSVTQQFSTSTSVGRMTLNLLATFAQFERETISERTRDKIAATRRKGFWTGGRPVLGYDARDGKLIVNPDEAGRVRAIFALYLERRSLLQVVEELGARSWRNKTWTNKRSQLVLGRQFDRSSLHHLLTNPLYVGKVTLGDELHDGAHEPLVNRETWDAVQVQLKMRGSAPAVARNKYGVLLRGLLLCTCGSSMVHHYASRGNRRWSYYVCQRAQKEGAGACPGSRISIGELESYVVERIRAVGRDPKLLQETLAAAQKQAKERGPEIDTELQQIDRDHRQLMAERKRLAAAVGARESGSPAILDRIADIDRQLEATEGRDRDLKAECAALEGATVNETDLKAALTAFDPLWAALAPRERARVLQLLIQRITFHGETSEVAITFRAQGLRSLARIEDDGNTSRPTGLNGAD